ncbi:MAG: UDP-N-acetylmuramate dehydrogenase [Chitinophagales bacterium]
MRDRGDLHELAQELHLGAPAASIRLDEPMSFYTTMRVGGPADLIIEPTRLDDVVWVVRRLRRAGVPCLVMGQGSNLIVRDGGVRGVVLRLSGGYARIEVDGNRLTAQAGATLGSLSRAALRAGLAGLEFAVGIPGTLGGGIFMNAGAYGGELGPLVHSCLVVSQGGELARLACSDLAFGYRHSILQEQPWYALEATLELRPGNREEIAALMRRYTEEREAKQPLDMPSAGSVFRRPEGYFVGKLVTDAGLRGFRLGGAQVSEKHAGFIVNAGGATAADILALIDHVQQTVRARFGVSLETEVRIVGEDR